MVGVAVNVTLVPVQIVEPGFAAMLIEVGNDALTVIEMALLVAVEEVTQLFDEVIVHVMTSLFAKVVLE